MLVDMHAHFPMHLLTDDEQRTHERVERWWRQRWEGEVVDLISHFANYQGRGDSPSVTEQLMRTGDVGVALSVLYQPFDEMDLMQPYGAPPRPGYFQDVIDQHQTVEDYVAAHLGDVAIAHSPAELDALLPGHVPILIHAIEGGFQVGADPAEVRGNAARLAELGIAYVTVAHLFFRSVATNAPALPFLPDRVYNRLFQQPRGEGLTELGRELVHALVDVGILIDITHMRSESITDVFELLDQRDPTGEIPVIATHMAYRFGSISSPRCPDSSTWARWPASRQSWSTATARVTPRNYVAPTRSGCYGHIGDALAHGQTRVRPTRRGVDGQPPTGRRDEFWGRPESVPVRMRLDRAARALWREAPSFTRPAHREHRRSR